MEELPNLPPPEEDVCVDVHHQTARNSEKRDYSPMCSLLKYQPHKRSIGDRASVAHSRFFRRTNLEREDQLLRQMARGRPDPSWKWCQNPRCEKEDRLFEGSCRALMSREAENFMLSEGEYTMIFAEKMVDALFPELEQESARMAKCRAIKALIDSPPVVAAFWRFTQGAKKKRVGMPGSALLKTILEAQRELRSLMPGGTATEREKTIHRYLNLDQMPTEDGLGVRDYALQFMIIVELWRGYSVKRFPDWNFGLEGHTAELIAALFLHLCDMHRDRRFATNVLMSDKRWTEVWAQWLDAYSVRSEPFGEEGHVLRRDFPVDEDEVLREVGYLGGVGTYAPVWTSVPRRISPKARARGPRMLSG